MNLRSLFLALFLVGQFAVNSMGIVRPDGTHVPTLKADLQELSRPITFPQARTITMNRVQGENRVGSFDVYFDTGLRCIKAPCPSFKTDRFLVTKVQKTSYGTVKYFARQILKNIPANVRLAPMQLVLEDHKNDMRPVLISHRWIVKFKIFGQEEREFGGNPEPVYVIE